MIKNLFLFSILSNYFLNYLFIKKSKKNFLVKPNARSMHKNPTITGGGISFVITSVLLSFFIDNPIT